MVFCIRGLRASDADARRKLDAIRSALIPVPELGEG